MESITFFRFILPLTSREDLWEQKFNLVYHTGGGITLNDVEKMKRKEFQWYKERIILQSKLERDAAENQAGVPTTSPSTGKMKYLNL